MVQSELNKAMLNKEQKDKLAQIIRKRKALSILYKNDTQTLWSQLRKLKFKEDLIISKKYNSK